MLDMGFVRDVRAICAVIPKKRETLLFSATMPPEVAGLANALLANPVDVRITPQVTTAITVEQSVVFVAKADKRALLERLLKNAQAERVIVFTRTKHGANRLSNQLARAGIRRERSRQQVAERSHAGARSVQGGLVSRARGDRRGLARHRRRRHLRTSSTTSFPRRRKSTSTVSGGRGEPARRARAITFCNPEERESPGGHRAAHSTPARAECRAERRRPHEPAAPTPPPHRPPVSARYATKGGAR